MNPYENTNIKNFGGKPLEDYNNEIKLDVRYVKGHKHKQHDTNI